MKKLLAVLLFVMFLMPLAMSQAVAVEEVAIVDVDNKMCPLMGGPVNGTDSVVHEGKRYGLCCPGCKKLFLSDPAKYAAKADAEKSAEMERVMDQGEL